MSFADAAYLIFDYIRAIKFCTYGGGKVLKGVRADIAKSLMPLAGYGA